MERPRPGDVPPATATRTINIMIQHDLWILRSRSIVKAYSVLAGRSGSCDREDLPVVGHSAMRLPCGDWHRDCHWDHQKCSQFMDNEMQGSYSGLSTCS
jgi:hypothetical protein